MDQLRRGFSDFCMYATILVAGSVMLGWFLDLTWLTDPPPDRVQMQFNTTLCAFSIACSQLRFMQRRRAGLAFAGLALGLASATFLEHLSGQGLGIDELFVTHPRDGRYSHPGRMALNTSLMLMLAGTVAVLARLWKGEGRLRLLASLSTVVVALALLSILGHITGIELAYGWSGSSQMSIPTSLCGLLIGLGMTQSLVERSSRDDRRLADFALLHLPVLGVAVSVFLWIGLEDRALDGSNPRAPLFRHLILLGGLVLSLGSAALISSLNRTRQAEKLARKSLDDLSHALAEEQRALQALSRTQGELQTSSAQLDAVFNTAVDAIIVIDVQGQIQAANPATARVFGYSRRELLQKNIRELMPSPHREQHDSYLANYLGGQPARLIGATRELEGLRSTGDRIPILVSVGEMVVNGERRFAGVIRDISDLKKTQIKLERSNEELRQFAFAASHDLREPLRMIASYVEILENQLTGQLNDQQLQFMHFARDGSLRMQEMISSLLEYAKAGRDYRFGEDVRFNQVVTKAIESLQLKIEESKAEVHVGDLPRVIGNQNLLMRLTENLISNALKFVHPGESPRITIAGRPVDGGVAVDFIDQGIGIPPDKLDEIFKIFYRLHSRERYPGLGMGLALAMKIAKDHGGELRVKNNEGPGMTFSLVFPKKRVLDVARNQDEGKQDGRSSAES